MHLAPVTPTDTSSPFAKSPRTHIPRWHAASFILLLVLLSLGWVQQARAAQEWMPAGGQVRYVQSLVTVPAAPSTVYATSAAGVFKSTDGGTVWMPMNTGLDSPSGMYSLAIDPAQPDVVYAGADGRVYKTTNGGASWYAASVGLPEQEEVLSLKVDLHAPETVFALTSSSGVYKTTNGGTEWISIGSGLPSVDRYFDVALHPSLPNTLYTAVSGGAIYRSGDGGASWSALDRTPSRIVNVIFVHPTRPGTLLALTNGDGIYRSTNDGTSWTAAISHIDLSNPLSIAYDAASDTLYAITSHSLFKSADGGASWYKTDLALLSGSSVVANPATPGVVLAGHGYGVFKSTDGGTTWTGQQPLDVARLAIDPTAPATLYAGDRDRGMFKTTDAGAHWKQINVGLTSPLVTEVQFDPHAPGTLYVLAESRRIFDWSQTLYDGGIFKSTDRGESWTPINNGLTLPESRPLNVTSLAFDRNMPGTMYAGTYSRGMFKSTDGGASWWPINQGLPSPTATTQQVRVAPGAPGAPDTLYTLVGFGGFSHFKSSNSGASWEPISAQDEIEVSASLIASDPKAPRTRYAVVPGKGFFKSVDGAGSWTLINPSAQFDTVVALAVDPDVPNTVYAQTSYSAAHGIGGLFRSSEAGVNWERINSEWTTPFITSVVMAPSTGVLFGSSSSAGVFKVAMGRSSIALPNIGQSVVLPLPAGGTITATARQPDTVVQLSEVSPGVTVAVVHSGSASLQHSTAGQPVTAIPRNGALALLTPSCATARVTVTVTGDTRTVFNEGCAVALSGAGEQQPAMESLGNIPAQAVRVFAPGPLEQRSLLVSVDVPPSAGAASYKLYVLAFVPGNGASPEPVIMQRLPTGGWAQLDLPAAVLAQHAKPQSAPAQLVIEVEKDSNLTSLGGAEIYIGYGTSEDEMLQAGRFRAVYRVQ